MNQTTRPKKFIIDRSKWRCGGNTGNPGARGQGSTLLLNSEGYMCCLGQVCTQLGVPDQNLLDLMTPIHIEDDFISLPQAVGLTDGGEDENSDFADEVMKVNDDGSLDDSTREQQLIDMFAEQGYTLEFTGEYGAPVK